MLEADFILKTTPPRLPRTALERNRLSRIWDIVCDRTAITVLAPSGFGKTTLLVHWRRRWLAEGAFVAWLTADRHDDPARFNLALLHAIRTASGRASLDTSATENAANTDHGIDTLTGLLAEIASLGRQTVLIVDDAERLPDDSRRSLAYLLYNAPSNLHVVIGTRVPLDLRTSEIAAKGNSALLKVDDLRLQLEETMAILGKRFAARLSLDECVRLHEATEGWPIGLQLAIATIEPESDLSAAIRSLSGRKGDIERYFIESLFSRLSVPVADFLTRIAILDRMDAPMCEAVTGCASSSAYLDQLMLDTPVLIVAELQGSDCIRSCATSCSAASKCCRAPSNRNCIVARAAGSPASSAFLKPRRTRSPPATKRSRTTTRCNRCGRCARRASSPRRRRGCSAFPRRASPAIPSCD